MASSKSNIDTSPRPEVSRSNDRFSSRAASPDVTQFFTEEIEGMRIGLADHPQLHVLGEIVHGWCDDWRSRFKKGLLSLTLTPIQAKAWGLVVVTRDDEQYQQMVEAGYGLPTASPGHVPPDPRCAKLCVGMRVVIYCPLSGNAEIGRVASVTEHGCFVRREGGEIVARVNRDVFVVPSEDRDKKAVDAA